MKGLILGMLIGGLMWVALFFLAYWILWRLV